MQNFFLKKKQSENIVAEHALTPQACEVRARTTDATACALNKTVSERLKLD